MAYVTGAPLSGEFWQCTRFLGILLKVLAMSSYNQYVTLYATKQSSFLGRLHLDFCFKRVLANSQEFLQDVSANILRNSCKL